MLVKEYIARERRESESVRFGVTASESPVASSQRLESSRLSYDSRRSIHFVESIVGPA